MTTPARHQARLTEIQLDDVSRIFGHGSRRFTAVDKVAMRIGASARVGIVGESGSGKSTVSRLIAALDSPSEGEIYVDGATLRSIRRARGMLVDYRRTVQMVAQDSTSSFDPLQKVRTAIRTPAVQLAGLDRKAADARVDETLTDLGLPLALAERHPGELSGGQRQRMSLARALVVRPRVLICDEVVSALDVSVQGQVLNMIKRYCLAEDAGLIFVSHGLPATAFICDRLVVMRNGRIVEDGDTDQVLRRPNHPYTKQLVDAFHGAPREHAEALATAVTERS